MKKRGSQDLSASTFLDPNARMVVAMLVAPKTKNSCIPGVATRGPNPKAGSLFVLSFHLKRGEPQNSTNKVGVPGTGLEPARLATHAPQACVSANFTTRARGIKVDYFLNFETF